MALGTRMGKNGGTEAGEETDEIGLAEKVIGTMVDDIHDNITRCIFIITFRRFHLWNT
jgi:hypothetical protein